MRLKTHVINPSNPNFSLCGRYFPKGHERCQDDPTENICGHCRQSYFYIPPFTEVESKLNTLAELEKAGKF